MGVLRPDVVFDCNVFLQAITRATGPAAHALRLVEQGAVTLHVSRPVLRELRLTLAYPEIRQRNPQVTDEVVDRFIALLLFRGQLHRTVARLFPFPRDPKDEPYIDLAVAVGADYLVTRDKDLLSLATGHSMEAKQFRQRLPGIKIVNPVDFIAAITQSP
jgi:putative PIN family toxin of toxin-antitoxin system